MQTSRPLKIFQRTRKPTRPTKVESHDTEVQPVKTQQPTPDDLKAPYEDCLQLPELYSGSESEEEIVHINFETIGSNKISPPNQQQQTQIPVASNDSIQSVAEVDKILEEIQNPKDPSRSQPKMPEKNKRIYKRRKNIEPVQFGELFIGRLKKRDRIKPKVTFNDVDEIYRCQCGKDYLSYMGIYRHIKTIHLQKDQYQLFRLHTSKDHKTGKTIKTVIIERSTNPHPEKGSNNRERARENLNENIVFQHSSVKQEEGSLNQSNLSLNYDEALSQSRQIRQQPDIGSEPTISLSKYEKLIEDYQKILSQMYQKEKQNLERTQRLMQQNSMLYQAKEKYKLKLKLLQAKLQSYMINLEAKDSIPQETPQNTSQNDTTPLNDNTIFQFSASSQQSCSLPQFSTFNISNSSLYGSSIEEVFSLGVKSQPKKKYSKRCPQPQLSDVKGILFDPQLEENKANDCQKQNERRVKFEDGESERQQSLIRSNRTSQQTPCFKGEVSDTETQYGELENGRTFLFKSEDIASRSLSFR